MRSSIALSVAILVAGPSSHAWGETSGKDLKQAGALTDQGNESFAKGDSAKARGQFEKALALVPAYPEALLGLGHIHLKEARFHEALESYRHAKDAYPQMGKAIFDLRVRAYDNVQRQIANYRNSIQSLRSQLASIRQGSDPTSIERQIVQLEEAIRKLQVVQPPSEATALEAPGEVHYHIGNALFRLNQFKEAVSEWETCATVTPEFPTVRINLCVAYWKLGRFQEAKAQLQRAEALGFPVNPKMKEDLAKAESAAQARP